MAINDSLKTKLSQGLKNKHLDEKYSFRLFRNEKIALNNFVFLFKFFYLINIKIHNNLLKPYIDKNPYSLKVTTIYFILNIKNHTIVTPSVDKINTIHQTR